MLNRQRGENGFTLIELVISVSILGIVMAALVGIVFQHLRLTGETSARLNESTDQQFVSAYWQEDVSSVGVRGFSSGTLPPRQSVWKPSTTTPTGVPAACTGLPSGSTLVVGFIWNDYPSGNSDPYATWTNAKVNAAVYYTKVVDTQLQLWRLRCSPAGSKEVRVAHHLDPANPPIAKCIDSAGANIGCESYAPFPAAVTLTLAVDDTSPGVSAQTGYKTTLTAQVRQG